MIENKSVPSTQEKELEENLKNKISEYLQKQGAEVGSASLLALNDLLEETQAEIEVKEAKWGLFYPLAEEEIVDAKLRLKFAETRRKQVEAKKRENEVLCKGHYVHSLNLNFFVNQTRWKNLQGEVSLEREETIKNALSDVRSDFIRAGGGLPKIRR